MTPEDEERIAQLVKLIQIESETAKLLALMEELSQFLGEQEARTALLRAGKAIPVEET